MLLSGKCFEYARAADVVYSASGHTDIRQSHGRLINGITQGLPA